MTIRLIDGEWAQEFTEAVRSDPNDLRIICPFIKVGAIDRLLSSHPRNMRVITRFNLADFAECVSDIAALRRLLEAGAKVRGVKNLHAKLYVFGERQAIITSANLTDAALSSNHEFGMVADDAQVIKGCLDYFDKLWKEACTDLLQCRVDEWEAIVKTYKLSGGQVNQKAHLNDFGVDIGITDPPANRLPTAFSDARQAFVKLMGSSRNRIPLSESTIDEINSGGIHWAVSNKKRLRSVEEGDVIFIGRLTKNPHDIQVFGRAIGMKHQPGRDDATEADIEKREWKAEWPRYIRVHHAEFVDGAMKNGVSLYELMGELAENSFASTKRNADSGNGNTNPRRAFSQQGAVKLSDAGFQWLNERLQAAFETHGKVSQYELDQLNDWPDPSLIPASVSGG